MRAHCSLLLEHAFSVVGERATACLEKPIVTSDGQWIACGACMLCFGVFV